MSESNNSAWPFGELEDSGGLDVSAIFGDSAGGSDVNPFDTPAAQPQEAAPEPVPAPQPKPEETPAPQTQAHSTAPAAIEQPKPQAAPEGQTRKPDAPASAEPANPIAAAFGQQEEKAAQTAAKSLFEKPPVFAHKSVKEDIEDASMTFEELRIQKSEDFADLEEGKYVSWTVEYCGIRKEIKDPKGTTIISMKETIERSREFLNALKKSKDKSPDCLVKPKVVMKTKGTAVYCHPANKSRKRERNKIAKGEEKRAQEERDSG